MAAPEHPRPRRPFEGFPEPDPFYRTGEFQRFIWLAGALVMVLFMALYFTWRARGGAGAAPAAGVAHAPPALLGPAEKEAREQRLLTLFEGSLRDTKNGDDFVETGGYRRLLQILMSFPPEEVSRRATRKLDYAACLADPDAWRGEFVWTRGVIAQLYPERLHSPVFGARDVFRCFLTDADEGVAFDMGDQPPTVEMRRDPYDVEGIFYRTLRYEGQTGKVREVPYLLVRNIRPVRDAQAARGGFLRENTVALLVGMALAILASRLLMYVFQRRRRPAPAPRPADAGFRALFAKKIHGDRTSGSPPSA